MPKERSEFYIRTGLQSYINNVRATLEAKIIENAQRNAALDAYNARYPQGSGAPAQPRPTLINGIDGICSLMDQLEALIQLDVQTFGEDGSREPSPAELYSFGQKCSNCLSSMELVSKYNTNSAIVDEDVLSVSLDLSFNIADKISAELKPYTKIKMPVPDQGLTRRQKEEAEELVANSIAFIADKIDERVVNIFQKENSADSIWKEFPNDVILNEFDGEIEDKLQISGSSRELAEYFVKNRARLTNDEMNYLLGRIGSMEYIKRQSELNREDPPAPVFSVNITADKSRFKLDGYQGRYQYQTTGCGCWSCAYSMLLEAYGRGINQQILRAARPDASSADMQDVRQKSVAGIIHDDFYSPFENADICSKIVPNAAMRQVGIESLDPGNISGAIAEFKKYVTEAICEHHSPVALTNGTHFITIVGIDKNRNTMTILNSLGDNEGLEEVKSIDEYLTQNRNITLTYLQSLEFSKEGKCTNIPGQFGNINYKDGKLLNLGDNSDSLNMDGSAFMDVKYSEREIVSDYIYLPDEVPEKYFGLQLPKPETRVLGNAPQIPARPGNSLDSSNLQDDPELRMALGLSKAAAKKEAKISDIRLALCREIEEAHNQLAVIASGIELSLTNPDDPNNLVDDPYEALRYTAATLIARSTLLDVFDRSKDQDIQLGMERLVRDISVVNDVAKSKSFNDFYDQLGNAQIARLIFCDEDKREAVRTEFHNKFVKFMAEHQAVGEKNKTQSPAEKNAPEAGSGRQKEGQAGNKEKDGPVLTGNANRGPVLKQ